MNISIPSTVGKLSSRELFFLIIFGIAMANIGFDSNIFQALSCGLYYFDYLAYLTLGYFLIRSIPKLKKARKSYLLLIGYVLVVSYGFEWGYTSITPCAFSPILFVTSKSPFIASITMILLIPRIENKNVPDQMIILKKLVNGSIRLSARNIYYAKVKHGVVHIYLKDGSTVMVNESLKSIGDKLAKLPIYYKLNRQIIVNENAISQIKSISGKGLSVQLSDGTHALVNKNKTAAFRRWFYA